MVEAVVSLAVLMWLASARRLWRAWPLMLIAMAVTAMVSAVLLHLLRVAANQLG